jgi:predicted transcriptional regulator
MRQQRVLVFTEKEDWFVTLLTRIRIRKTVAYLLVFPANTPKATSRNRELRTDSAPHEVSPTIKYLNK